MELFKLGLVLVFTGFIIAFVAVLLPLLISGIAGKLEFAGGGCIIIMFIPICFGYGNPVLIAVLMVIAIVLVVVSYLVFKSLRKPVESHLK